MQWNADTDAGFSTAKTTWLPVGSDYRTVNVQAEERDPNSLLTRITRKLIRLRKENRQLRDGSFVLVDEANENVLSFLRKTTDGKAGAGVFEFQRQASDGEKGSSSGRELPVPTAN